jgi:hypothetical protein
LPKIEIEHIGNAPLTRAIAKRKMEAPHTIEKGMSSVPLKFAISFSFLLISQFGEAASIVIHSLSYD